MRQFGTGEELVTVELIVREQAAHDVILRIEFLRHSGATVECGTDEICLCGAVLPSFLDAPEDGRYDLFSVVEDVVLPAMAGISIQLKGTGESMTGSDVLVEPNINTIFKKNVLVPRALVEVADH